MLFPMYLLKGFKKKFKKNNKQTIIVIKWWKLVSHDAKELECTPMSINPIPVIQSHTHTHTIHSHRETLEKNVAVAEAHLSARLTQS